MDHKNLQQRLLERLIRTQAIQVRKDMSDAPFWYTSGRPGPFYINVERIAGQAAVAKILDQINHILVSSDPAETKAKQVWGLVMTRLEEDQEYREVMHLLVDFYRSGGTAHPTLVSGGERRDWFFSIPFAHLLEVPHLFLLKKGGHWLLSSTGEALDEPLSIADQGVLHVADIVNTASSYLRYWIPNLASLHARFDETLTVAVRSQDGIQALQAQGIRVQTPLTMGLPVFAEARDMHLISDLAYQDIELFLRSPKDWTRNLLETSASGLLNDFAAMSNLDQSRLFAFVSTDPYQLRGGFPEFFAQVDALQH